VDAKSLRGWLLCKPRPVKLRIVREGEPAQTLEIQDGMSYAAVAKSVVAMTPDLVEALDKDGQVIRALRPEDDEEEDEEQEEEQEQGFAVPTDGETQRFIIVAKLVGDAYKHSTSVAFDKLGEMFQAIVTREEAQARSLEAMQKLMMKQALESAAEGNAPEGSFEQMMIQSVLQGMARKQAEEAAKPHVNGAANGATPKAD
jgi:hypothetical protein